MYAINEIPRLPSIQRIAESFQRQLGLTVGVISAAGERCWPGSLQTRPPSDIRKLQACSAEWLEQLMNGPVSSMIRSCGDGLYAIAVPVFENSECTAAVFAAFFRMGAQDDAPPQASSGYPCLSRRESRFALDMLMEIASEIRENAPVLMQNRESARYSCDFSELIGSSAPMKSLLNELELVCQSESCVLIEGEAGTGKQLIARTIHRNSPRRTRPFTFLDCSSIAEDRMASELFGHKRGAFAGAMTDQPGMLDVSNGGTLLLNEIQALSAGIQFRLLKLLETGYFLPVGDTIPHTANVRVIASSSQSLENAVGQGAFRQDLYYRLGVMKVHVPTLADRRDDILELAQFFISRFCHRRRIPHKSVSAESLEILKNYDWPGNLLEFESEIERLVILCALDDEILPENISPRIVRTQSVKKEALDAMSAMNDAGAIQENFKLFPGQTLADTLSEIERRIIALTLKQNDGNRTKAAEILGVSRRNLIRKIESLGIDA